MKKTKTVDAVEMLYDICKNDNIIQKQQYLI